MVICGTFGISIFIITIAFSYPLALIPFFIHLALFIFFTVKYVSYRNSDKQMRKDQIKHLNTQLDSSSTPAITKISHSPTHPSCIVVGVTFEKSNKVYYYLSDSIYSKNTYVRVPTQDGAKDAKVVSSIRYGPSESLPYEYSKMKKVIMISKRSGKSGASFNKFIEYDPGDELDYPYFREQEEFDRELERLSYIDEDGVFHDLRNDDD